MCVVGESGLITPAGFVPGKPSMLQGRSSWFLLKEILSRGGVGVLTLWGF